MKRLVAPLFVLALAATACSGSGSDGGSGNADGGASGSPVVDGTLTIALDADPGNLNPLLSTANNVRELTPFTYDTLVYLDPATGEAKSALAESWEESPTELSFVIRDGVTCQDDTEFTAETVANNINFVADPDNASALFGVFVTEDMVATADPATRTVTVTAESPNSFMLAQVGSLEMVCQAGLDDPESLETTSNGTGMYEVTEAVPNDHYTLTRRDDYAWAPDGGNGPDVDGVPKTVEFRVVENVSTRANLLLSGDVDLAPVTGPDEERVAAETDAVRRQPFIQGQFYFSEYDGQPAADDDVRIALVHALDLDALTDVMTSNQGYRAERLAMQKPNPCEYDAATPNLPEHDPELAAQMLDEAGWVENADGIREKDGQTLSLSLIYADDNETNAPTMELAAQQLGEVGVELDIEGSDTSAYLDKLYGGNFAGDFDIANQNVNFNFTSVLAPWNSGPNPPAGRNATNVQNEDYNALRDQALELPGQESCDTWEQAEAALFAAADSVPFAARDNVVYGRGVATTIDNTISAYSVTLVD